MLPGQSRLQVPRARRAAQIGGGTKTAELTLSGFHHDVCSSIHGRIQSNPLLRNNELNLGEYGLEYIFPDPVYHIAFPDGSYITKWRDFDRTCEEIAKYSKKDAETWHRMANEADSIRKLVNEVEYTPVGFGKSLTERLAEHPQGKLWQRRMAMSKWDVLHENFEDERTMVAMMPPFPKELTGPYSGLSAYPSKKEEVPQPKGGSEMIATALSRFLEARGGEILVNKPVEQLIIDSGKCVGVECADGTSYRADKAVVSTVHIKRLVQMAPKDLWPDDFLEGVKTFSSGGASFNSHFATTEPLKFQTKGGTIVPVHISNIQSCKRALRFESELTMGEFSLEEPVLHIVQTSVADPSRAPAGMHTVRILCEQAVYNLPNGGPARWAGIKAEVAEAHLKAAQKIAPNLTDDKILARFSTSPVDIEQMNPSMWHGSCHSGTDGPAQAGAMRPVPGYAQHRMPIPGLYQTGATTHPGGGVSGGPGRNAAVVMLKDFGTSMEEVLSKKG